MASSGLTRETIGVLFITRYEPTGKSLIQSSNVARQEHCGPSLPARNIRLLQTSPPHPFL